MFPRRMVLVRPCDAIDDLLEALVGELVQLGGGAILDGCGTTTSAGSNPSAVFCASAAWTNSVVITLTPAMPRPSRSMRSCKLHDVHEPQSESAITTTFDSTAIRCSNSVGATRLLLGFL